MIAGRLKRIANAAVAAALSVGMLAGCTDKTVDYNIDNRTEEDTEASVSEAESQTEPYAEGFEQFQSLAQKRYVDSWNAVTDDGRKVRINIRTMIEIPDVQAMCVLEVCEPGFDAEYKEKVIKAIFGTSDIYSYETDKLPREDLLKLIDEKEYELKRLEEYCEEAHKRGDEDMEQYFRDEIDEGWEMIDMLEKYAKNAGSEYTPVDDYEGNLFMGYIDGIRYMLKFEKKEDREIEKNIVFKAVDMHDLCSEKIKDSKYCDLVFQIIDNKQDNLCKTDLEEIKGTVEDFLDAMGVSVIVGEDVREQLWSGLDYRDEELTDENIVKDGFMLNMNLGTKYGPIYELLSNYLDGGWKPDSAESDEGGIYSTLHIAYVSLNDSGVAYADICSPMEIVKQTDDVKLLSFDIIEEIMKDELSANPYEYTLNKAVSEINIDSISLIYYRMKDKKEEGRYCFVPAWEFSSSNYDTLLIINAIDGTVIDVDETL